jgi:hypothetical protein
MAVSVQSFFSTARVLVRDFAAAIGSWPSQTSVAKASRVCEFPLLTHTQTEVSHFPVHTTHTHGVVT